MSRRRLGTRAVKRRIEAGTNVYCTGCDTHINYVVRKPADQIIANVYNGPTWDRVEHWHADCYRQAGNPHGRPRN